MRTRFVRVIFWGAIVAGSAATILLLAGGIAFVNRRIDELLAMRRIVESNEPPPAQDIAPRWSQNGACRVSREALFGMMGAPHCLAPAGSTRSDHHVRIVPEIRDGRPAGFRIYGVRPGTVTAALGLRDGDVVRAVNGNTLATPEQTLAAYASLKGANELVYEVERDGRPLVLRCAVRATPALLVRADPNPCTIDLVAFFDVLRSMVPGCPRIVEEGRREPPGIRVRVVAPGSRAEALGFRKGDVLHAINGVVQDKPDRMFDAYAVLKSAREITWELDRNGERILGRCTLEPYEPTE